MSLEDDFADLGIENPSDAEMAALKFLDELEPMPSSPSSSREGTDRASKVQLAGLQQDDFLTISPACYKA